MAGNGTVMVGTVGTGLHISRDKGETWTYVRMTAGIHSEAIVRALVWDPRRPEVMYAGTDTGLHRTEDGGVFWQPQETPMGSNHVWALAIDPVDPDIMYAGTGTFSTPGIYRSTDSGKSWEIRPMEIAESCVNVGIPRPTAITIDPADHRSVWVGLEVDGVRHSTDGGDTWKRIDGDCSITNPDVHAIVVLAGQPKTVWTLVNDDMWVSQDDGATWKAQGAQEIFSPWHYVRGIAVKSDDPQIMFVGLGDYTPGSTGAMMRSRDAGKSWESLKLPVPPNSTIMTVAANPVDSNVVFAASYFGYLYRSDDGGDSWTKLSREFGCVLGQSPVVCVPN